MATTHRGSAVTITTAATAVALTLVVPSLWDQAGTGVLVVGLLIGVPHGAVDHLLPLYRHRSTTSTLPLFIGAYAAVAALSWVAITTFRAAGLIAFLTLSAVHFGTGEATFAHIRDGHRSGTQWKWIATGIAIIALPITTHQNVVLPYLQAFAPHTRWELGQPAAQLLTAIILVIMVGVVAAHLRNAAYLQATETTLLMALMTLAPPTVAVGVYFGAWHSVRHLMILLAENPTNRADLTQQNFGRPVRRFAVAAVLPTTAALGMIAIVWFGAANGHLHQFIAQDLAILAALTVPHTAAVWWLDHTRTTAVPPQSIHGTASQSPPR